MPHLALFKAVDIIGNLSNFTGSVYVSYCVPLPYALKIANKQKHIHNFFLSFRQPA